MTKTRNRNRLSQIETTCRILRALGAGRWTTAKIATYAGVSTKTVRRYVDTLSAYFGIQEHEDGREHFYWLDDAMLTVRGRTPERFCAHGHDKFAEGGGHYYRRNAYTVALYCVICKRATDKRYYQRNRATKLARRRAAYQSRLPSPKPRIKGEL